jgi:hypothetical protein
MLDSLKTLTNWFPGLLKCLKIRAPRSLFQQILKGLSLEMDLAFDDMYWLVIGQANPLLLTYNYTPLVISRNDKNKQQS